jgi:hypothetical protein
VCEYAFTHFFLCHWNFSCRAWDRRHGSVSTGRDGQRS